MRNMLAIARRELGSYFGSMLGYVVTAAFLFINGLFFFLNVVLGQSATIAPIVQTVLTILLFFVPLLSMRLLAEEQRTGTLELLLTAPVRDYEVVIGKYLAGLGLLGVMLGLTLVYPAILFALGSPDRGTVVGGYLAMILFGAGAVAIGLFVSSLTQNQIVAGAIPFAVLLMLWVADGFASAFGGGTLGTIFNYLNLYSHFRQMTQGLVVTNDVVYYLSLIVGALFLSTRALEARRWNG
jgi:ABC-2 type transport system permease protein